MGGASLTPSHCNAVLLSAFQRCCTSNSLRWKDHCVKVHYFKSLKGMGSSPLFFIERPFLQRCVEIFWKLVIILRLTILPGTPYHGAFSSWCQNLQTAIVHPGGAKEKQGCCLHRYHTAELSLSTTGIVINTLCANTDKMTNQLPLLAIRKQGEVFACEVYMSIKI